MSSKTDKTWVETIHEIHTGDSFFYQVGPDPDGLSLELRYLEFDPVLCRACDCDRRDDHPGCAGSGPKRGRS